MGIFNINDINNNYFLDEILQSLKSKINTEINNSYYNYQFRNMKDINNWKNEIIKLINKEINKIPFKLQQYNK